MKKNDELFKEAKLMLSSEMMGSQAKIESYYAMLHETEEALREVKANELEALNSGNSALLDSSIERKNVLEEKLRLIKSQNPENYRKNIGELKKKESADFFRSVMAEMKERELEDFQEASKLMKDLYVIFDRAEVRRTEALGLFNSWTQSVAPFIEGQQTIIHTTLSRAKGNLDRDNFVGKIKNGDSSNMFLSF